MISLDASVLVPLFVQEPRTNDAAKLIQTDTPATTPLTIAEASCAFSRRYQAKELNETQTLETFDALDIFSQTHMASSTIELEDYETATQLVRRIDLGLRTADALHIAVAMRLGATLATFARKMADAARSLGIDVVD